MIVEIIVMKILINVQHVIMQVIFDVIMDNVFHEVFDGKFNKMFAFYNILSYLVIIEMIVVMDQMKLQQHVVRNYRISFFLLFDFVDIFSVYRDCSEDEFRCRNGRCIPQRWFEINI